MYCPKDDTPWQRRIRWQKSVHIMYCPAKIYSAKQILRVNSLPPQFLMWIHLITFLASAKGGNITNLAPQPLCFLSLARLFHLMDADTTPFANLIAQYQCWAPKALQALTVTASMCQRSLTLARFAATSQTLCRRCWQTSPPQTLLLQGVPCLVDG